MEVLVGVVADAGARVFGEGRGGVLKRNLRGGSGHVEFARGQVHDSGRDLNRNLGGFGDRVLAALLDGDERVGLQDVIGAVREDDARHAVAARLDEIAALQLHAVIGADKLLGLGLADAHVAVQIHEMGLANARAGIRSRRGISKP